VNNRGSCADSDADGGRVEFLVPEDYRLPYEAGRALIRVILAVQGRRLGGEKGVA
jgi:hypothetical protein